LAYIDCGHQTSVRLLQPCIEDMVWRNFMDCGYNFVKIIGICIQHLLKIKTECAYTHSNEANPILVFDNAIKWDSDLNKIFLLNKFNLDKINWNVSFISKPLASIGKYKQFQHMCYRFLCWWLLVKQWLTNCINEGCIGTILPSMFVIHRILSKICLQSMDLAIILLSTLSSQLI